MGLVLFSALTLVFLYRLFSDAPELILNATGIRGKGASNKTYLWHSMKDAYINKVNNVTFICLVMKEEDNPNKDETGIRKDMIDFNKNFLGDCSSYTHKLCCGPPVSRWSRCEFRCDSQLPTILQRRMDHKIRSDTKYTTTISARYYRNKSHASVWRVLPNF